MSARATGGAGLFDLTGKVALVTGGTRGLGKAMARGLAEAGASLIVTGRKQASADEAAVELASVTGRSCLGVACHMGDWEQIDALVERAYGELGRVDILVNNAGINRPGPVDAEDYEEGWSAVLEVNLTAHVRLIRAALPHLEASDAGRVINISSTEGVGAQPFVSAYTAAKHGVIGLTRAMAVELGRRGVTFNCVCPGPIQTAMTAPIPDAAKEKFARRRVPLGRYGDPEEVAHATLGFALPAASYMNGAVLLVDGGLSIQNS